MNAPHLPSWKYELNLNTIIQTVTIIGFIVTVTTMANQQTARSDKLELWQTNHSAFHVERTAEVRMREGAWNEWRSGVDKQLQKMDNFEYRMSGVEKSADITKSDVDNMRKELNTSVTAIHRDLNEVVTTLKLVQQSLDRMETGTAATTREGREMTDRLRATDRP